ncbi:hypothetical protein [Oligoflexus tunisiensis]|uniref:hypothetical protein n=1 Tax=Oligoflexus tunisiensis TaxID=708132 RepID=UPI00114D1B97|nr:hypothetical protein [Oligoflexus tunisiensis]
MNFSQLGRIGLPALVLGSSPLPAQSFLPTENFLELGADVLQQEATGLRFHAAYLMTLGWADLVSRIGVELGYRLFDEADVPEYGFFLESTLFAPAAYALYLKTALHTLDFPDNEATASSMETVEIEWGARWVRDTGVWKLGLGVRYWNDPERIEIGDDVIEKEWLLYPTLGWAWRL